MDHQPKYYHVLIPGVLSATWIGGSAIPDGDHLWLTTPTGEPLLRVPREHVHESSREETGARLLADAHAAKEPLNRIISSSSAELRADLPALL